MKLTELLLAELDREVPRSRRALQEVPAGKYDWKPYEKSMILGYLANMVATMPSWLAMGVTMNELDVAPRQRIGDEIGEAETSEAPRRGARQERGRRARGARRHDRRVLMTRGSRWRADRWFRKRRWEMIQTRSITGRTTAGR